MDGLALYLLQECYGGVLCIVIILCFLFINSSFEKKIEKQFLALSLLALVDIVGGKAECWLGNQENYNCMRQILSWAIYIISPGILLIICEILLRKGSQNFRWLISIPELLNVAVVSTTFISPVCFWFDRENNAWHGGPLCWFPKAILVVYLVILLVAALLNVRESKSECLIIIISCVLLCAIITVEFFSGSPVSLRETTIGLTLLCYFMYFASVSHIDEVQEMIDQCIETLAYTIDAKDKYTKGHSTRVAGYSRMIARKAGKTPAECRQIYRAGLLHDIGKISISDAIINKNGKLTDEEYALIQKHPEKGSMILEKMKKISYLQNGARYHHERYDGKGYPAGLSGIKIPEYARIIAVADSYDAMTSNRSYRSIMEQPVVRQEMLEGMGTQFDPLYAELMISLIDEDTDYDLREKSGKDDEISFS